MSKRLRATMPFPENAVRLRQSLQRLKRGSLLAGVSALALLVHAMPAEARCIGFCGAGTSAATAAANSAIVSAQQAAQATAQSMVSLSRATLAVQTMQAAQTAAHNLALSASSNVPNGLAPGGLVVDPRVTAGTDPNLWVNANLPTQNTSNGVTTVTVQQTAQRAVMTWEQFNVGKNTVVNFDQSGGNSANGNNWIALNRIDATGVPSQIQGQIRAQGTVLIINPNGIIFDGSSQINVHTLIATAADLSSVVGTYQPVQVNGAALTLPSGVTVLSPGVQKEDNANTAFVNNGLYTVTGGLTPEFSLSAGVTGQVNQGIVVQQGASISSDVSGFDNSGYVALFGPNVTNNGSISTPAGQIILAAGNQLTLAQPGSGGTTLTIPSAVSPQSPPIGAAVTNSGILTATRGDIMLTGDIVNQFGVAEATTSITRAGSINIAATTLLTFGSSSVTAILPEENGEKIPLNSLSSFVAPLIAISANNMDMQGSAGGAPGALIAAPGATMTVGSNSQAAATPAGRVLLEAGSVIDLAGLNASASVADYLYTFKVTANDVADSPFARNLISQSVTIDLRQSGTRADGLTWIGSPLFSASASGYLGDIPQSIDQLLTKGGSLSFNGGGSSSFNTLQDVIAAPGSVINIAGGSITYTGGTINTTRLVGSDGRIYSIDNANPFIGYVGICCSFTVAHPHWTVTQVYQNGLISRGYYQSGYTDGVSAGSLSVIAGNPIFEGTLLGTRQLGARQTLLAESDTGANGTQALPDQLPLGAALSINAYGVVAFGNTVADAVLLEGGAPDVLGPNFTMNSPLQLPTTNTVTGLTPNGPATTSTPELVYSTDILSAGGFGSISLSSSSFISMAKGAVLSVLPGGRVNLSGVSTIDGAIIARAGKISITGFNFGNFVLTAPPVSAVTIGPDALLDASGLWVNDSGATSDAVQGSAFINGGSVSIRTYLEGTAVAKPGQSTTTDNVLGNQEFQTQYIVPIIDTTQSIVLAPGSIIDVSSGGYVGPTGKLKTAASGLPAGAGGSVTLLTYDNSNSLDNHGFWQNSVGVLSSSTNGLGQGGTFAPNQGNQPNQANVFLDGTIYSAGLSNGGTLTLQAPIIQIGGVSSVTSYDANAGARAGELALPASFFSQNGFSTYSLTSTYGGVTVAAGTTVLLQQQNYMLTSLPATGARVRDVATLAVAPLGARQPVNLDLMQRAFPAYTTTSNVSTNAGILIDNGAAIIGDPGASIALAANGPVTVLGRLAAPGGSIALTNNGMPEDVAFVAQLGGDLPQSTSAAPLDVWIGSNAVLDVSGAFVPNRTVTSYSTGTVLPGGTISLVGPTIIALPGSFFNLSGASANVQMPSVAAGRFGPSLTTAPLWSNGGTLSLNWSPVQATMPGLYQTAFFAGEVDTAGGAPQASGGSLIVGSQSGTASYGSIIIPQSGAVTSLLNLASLSNGSYAQTSAELNALGLLTSTTSNTVSTGTLTFNVAPGLGIPNGSSSFSAGLALGQRVTIAAVGNPQATMSGMVISYDPTKGALTVDITGNSGSGTYSNWNISTFASNGYAYVTADTLSRSHFDSITLVANKIAFSGNVSVTVPGALTVAGAITLLPAGSTNPNFAAPSIGGTVVNLNAGYALLAGRSFAAPSLSDSTLNVNATAQIDLAGALSVANAANVNLFSGGDIRLLSWTDAQFSQGSIAGYFNGFNATIPQAQAIVYSAGELQIPDNLTLAAREIYPTTDSAFLLLSNGLGSGGGIVNTITIASNGKAPSAPLSVDGQILIDAPSIVQGGVLYAPLGIITVGVSAGQSIPSLWKGGSAITTQSLVVASGSLTSVSAAGLELPYGTTINDTTWLSPSNFGSTALTAPPAKSIVLNGTSVNSMPGAVMDLSGGGDIYATEFVPGTGGSRNVLTGAGAGQSVYALVPSYQAPVAANDPIYGQAVGAGTSVTLAAGAGIAAGTYTLLPAFYATLPGAYRVVVVSPNTLPIARSIVAPDGSIYMSATLGNAITGARSSQTARLEVQPNATWTGYSEIDITRGNGFFAKLAASNGNFAPPIPADGGVLTVNATGQLNLQSSYNFTPGPGGRGGEAAITGTNLLVLAPDQPEPAADVAGGYILLNSDQLSSLGATTLLLGGTSALGANGLTITATATNLEVDSDAAHPLSGPELLLVTQASAGAKGLTVDAGSVIAAIGSVPAGTDTPITIGAGTAATASGSLLRVTSGTQVTINRTGASATGSFAIGTTPGTATVPATGGRPVTINGGVSLTLDTSGSGTLAGNSILTAQNYLLSGSVINLGNVPAGTPGLTISPQLMGEFDGANSVTLRSASSFYLYDTSVISFGTSAQPIGTLTLDGAAIYSNGGKTTIVANNIDLTDSQAAPNPGTPLSGSGGTLNLNAASAIILDAGAKTLGGFGQITFNAGGEILGAGSGSLNAGSAALVLSAADVYVRAGSNQSLTTTGSVTLLQGAGPVAVPSATDFGGSLSLTGSSITDSGAIIALGGNVTLTATQGDLVLTPGASIDARGSSISLFDLTEDAPGGIVQLVAGAGNVSIMSGATIDVSAAGNGYAGTVGIQTALTGTATLNGALLGGAAHNDTGGNFTLNAGMLSGALPFNSGFTGSFSATLAQGDIVVPAGTSLTSGHVLLAANNGNVVVNGTIDASGPSGGVIELYGSGTATTVSDTSGQSYTDVIGGVSIGSNAQLLACYVSCDPTKQAIDPSDPGYGNGEAALVQNGGTITLGTSGVGNGTLNKSYGYENVTSQTITTSKGPLHIYGSGAINVAAGAIFNVGGGPGGANISNNGGIVTLRAPILSDGTVNVHFAGTLKASTNGSSSGSIALDAYAVWSTADGCALISGGCGAVITPDQYNKANPQNPLTAAQLAQLSMHFDGFVDPAGWYDNTGAATVLGTDQFGYQIFAPTPTSLLAPGEFFTPITANSDHVGFYQQTLMDFVQTPFNIGSIDSSFAGAQGVSLGSTLHLRPEINLINPSSANGGNITVLTNWNLGAGVADSSGRATLYYRTTNAQDPGEPGVLALLAANNVQVNATLTDGFFQTYKNVTLPAIIPGSVQTPGTITNGPPPNVAIAAYNAELANSDYKNDLAAITSTGDLGLKIKGGGVVPLSTYLSPLGSSLIGPWQLQAPAIFSSQTPQVDQYNQFYADYVGLFKVFASEIKWDQKLYAKPSTLPTGVLPPLAPSSANAASYATPSTGYVALYANYMAYMIQQNAGRVLSLPSSISGTLAALTSAIDSDKCASCIPYAPPFAPYYGTVGGQPDMTSLPALQPGYVATPPVHVVTPPVGFVPPTLAAPATADQIAAAAAQMDDAISNNPGTDLVLNADYNTTTSSNLMSVGFAGSQGSFSYNVVGGAQFISGGIAADPDTLARVPSGAVTVGTSPAYSVTLNGHTSYLSANSASTTKALYQTINVPTVLRTGTGSITIAAAGSVELLDTTAPGAIYTAGAAAPLAAGFVAPSLPTSTGGNSTNGLVSNPSWAINGGAVTINAGTDIVGIETPIDSNGSATLLTGALTGEFWSAWYYRAGLSSGEQSTPFDPNWTTSKGLHAQQNSTWINYGTFFQGIGALGGGNVTLKAGADIDDISVSLPEAIQVSGGMSSSGPPATANFYGGGNLIVQSGGNLYSSTFYVGRGTGNIRVAGTVATDPFNPVTAQATQYSDVTASGTVSTNLQPLPLLLAVQDGFVTVTARQSLSLGGVFDPTTIPQDMSRLDVLSTTNGLVPAVLPPTTGATFNSYGPQSGVSLIGAAGTVALESLPDLDVANPNGNKGTTLFGFDAAQSYYPNIGPGANTSALTAPPTLDAQALGGDITLPINVNVAPSPTSTMQWFAAGSIMAQYQSSKSGGLLSVIDMLDGTANSTDHAPTLLATPIPPTLSAPLHVNDTSPAYFYAGNNIIGGFVLDKPATIWAGHNIINSYLIGENNNPTDITRVFAGNDITVAQDFAAGQVFDHQSAFVIYGPGTFLIEAGRNLGPFFTGTKPTIQPGVPGFSQFITGIYTIGDGSNIGNAALRPYLPVKGADAYALFGVGPGIDDQAAIANYVNPAAAGNGGINYLTYIAEALGETPDQAWATFQGLTTAQQDLLIDQAFLKFLSQVGLDYNNTASPYYHQYARAYDTIATLFPASRGYTDNRPTSTNGAAVTVSTGDFNVAHSLLETQNGGNINIIGPGGNIIVGFNATDNSTPSQEGILTLQGGSIRTYTDQSVMVYQSRIFTEQGGDVDMFSANGNLNAGKGPKSSAAYPPLMLTWDVDGYSRVSPAGLVTGAGIGALLTVPGQDPSLSNANLVAPRGTVDAGSAGIRVSGNLNIAALQILNAFNIQVQGTVTGLPTYTGPSIGALTSANNTAGAVQAAIPAPSNGKKEQPSIIIVEVVGYGGGDGNEAPDNGQEKPRPQSQEKQSYRPDSQLQVLGLGELTEQQRDQLKEIARRNAAGSR